MKNFRLTDSEYEKFMSWLKAQNFNFTPELEHKMETLIASAKNEKYYDQLQSSLSDLKSKITQARGNDLVRLKSEIQQVLEEEIAFHYLLSQGQIDASLDRDPEIVAARKLLNDKSRYQQLLSVQ